MKFHDTQFWIEIINAQTENKFSHIFSIESRKIVKKLIEAGADVNARVSHNWTALYLAADRGKDWSSI